MRRKEREITDPTQLRQILDCCKVCRIAMQDDQGLYLVPMNFGYELDDDRLTLYLHSAKEGRKISALSQNPQVCFEMDGAHKLVEGDAACGYSYEFQSIIGNGQAAMVEDVQEKEHALSVLMRHMTGREFSFDEKMAGIVTVIKIQALNFTGKAHQL